MTNEEVRAHWEAKYRGARIDITCLDSSAQEYAICGDGRRYGSGQSAEDWYRQRAALYAKDHSVPWRHAAYGAFVLAAMLWVGDYAMRLAG